MILGNKPARADTHSREKPATALDSGRARQMGFSLEQTKKLLLLRQKRVTPSFRIRNLLATTLFEIRQKIQTLEEAEKELQRILRKR